MCNAATIGLKTIVLLGCLWAQKAESQSIVVKEMIWTDSIHAAKRSYVNSFDQAVPCSRIHVVVKALCDTTALREIQRNGALPLVFQWSKKVSGTWIPHLALPPADFLPTASFPDSLKNTIHNNGKVMWTSWSVIDMQQRCPAFWKVKVVMRSNSLLLKESKIKVRQ